MRYIKLFENYKNIEYLCELYDIKKYTITDDGLVDVDHFVHLDKWDLTEIPLNFGIIHDYFSCENNKIKSLKGAPKMVAGGFHFNNNYLTSLEYCPPIASDYYFGGNELITLKGIPDIINGDLSCSSNFLTDLKYAPKEINNSFHCNGNQLSTLEGCPDRIGYMFNFKSNFVNSLKYIGKNIDMIVLDNNPLPEEIIENIENIQYIIKNQDIYKIWNNDGSFNKDRFDSMINDI